MAASSGLGQEVDSGSFGPQDYTTITPQITPQTCWPFWQQNLNAIARLGGAIQGACVEARRHKPKSPPPHSPSPVVVSETYWRSYMTLA